jgi:hypothetical protein
MSKSQLFSINFSSILHPEHYANPNSIQIKVEDQLTEQEKLIINEFDNLCINVNDFNNVIDIYKNINTQLRNRYCNLLTLIMKNRGMKKGDYVIDKSRNIGLRYNMHNISKEKDFLSLMELI